MGVGVEVLRCSIWHVVTPAKRWLLAWSSGLHGNVMVVGRPAVVVVVVVGSFRGLV
jgi:hypothetical protein